MLVIAEHIKCRSPIDRHCALPEGLDALIRHRVDLLTQYQDGAYATQYEKAVNKLRDIEGDPAFLQNCAISSMANPARITNSTLTSRLRGSHDAMQMVI